MSKISNTLVRNFEKERERKEKENFQFPKHCKKVHIGEDIWHITPKYWKNPTNVSTTIFSPDLEKHVISDTEIVNSLYFSDRSSKTNPNSANLARVKVFILTSILDKRDKWVFDLTKIPTNGKLKVIFENGTVKMIDFNGVFYPQELISKRVTVETNLDFEHEATKYIISRRFSWMEGAHSERYFVKPVAYKIK